VEARELAAFVIYLADTVQASHRMLNSPLSRVRETAVRRSITQPCGQG